MNGLTVSDDGATGTATQPAITVAGTLTLNGGVVIGAAPAGAVISLSSPGHVYVSGDINFPPVPFLSRGSSTTNYVELLRGNPVIGAEAVQLISPNSGLHYLNLQNDTGVNNVFIQQDTDANNNDFSISMQSGADFFTALQIDNIGQHIGFHGAADPNFNQHLYGTTTVDHFSTTGVASGPFTNTATIEELGGVNTGQLALKAWGANSTSPGPASISGFANDGSHEVDYMVCNSNMNNTCTFGVPVAAPGYSVGGVSGFTGTKTIGSCTLTIHGGLITGVSGC
jgi:hypothetical protein